MCGQRLKRFSRNIGVILLLFLVGSQVYSSPLDELEQILGSYEQIYENLELKTNGLSQVNRLRAESKQASDALEGLRTELELDTARFTEARGDVEQIEGDIDDLRDTNKRLREWLSKYGEAVEDI